MGQWLKTITVGFGAAVATAAVALMIEPWLPLGDWRWVIVAVAAFVPAAIAHRRNIGSAIKGLKLFGGKERFAADAGPASFHFTTSKATVSVRPPPWSRPILRIRSVWKRRRGSRPVNKRLQNVPDLQRCLDELIRYSGQEFPAKVTSREIGQSNALLFHLERACHVLDKQGQPHPKIEKGLVVQNYHEWIAFLSKLLAQNDGSWPDHHLRNVAAFLRRRVEGRTMSRRPMLDPERDLKGATPETLARALLRNRLGPRPAGKPVVGDEVAVEKVASYKPGHRVPHLRNRS